MERGLDAVIVHPSGIIGPEDYSGGYMTETIRAYLNRHIPLAVEAGLFSILYVLSMCCYDFFIRRWKIMDREPGRRPAFYIQRLYVIGQSDRRINIVRNSAELRLQ